MIGQLDLYIVALWQAAQGVSDDPWRALTFGAVALVVALMGLLKRHIDSIKTKTATDVKEVKKEVQQANVTAAASDAKSDTVNNTFGQVLEFSSATRAQTIALREAVEAANEQARGYQNTIRYQAEEIASLRTAFDARIKQIETLLREERQAREKIDRRNEALERRCDELATKYEADTAAWNSWADKVLMVFASIPGGEGVVAQIPPRPNGLTASHTTRRKATATKRDATRDAGRDEGRDLVRDPARDLARDIERDAELEIEGGKQDGS